MEFFILLESLFVLSNPLLSEMGVNPLPLYMPYIISAVLFAVIYAFKAIGLFTMAKKQGKDSVAWCAFVPFVSTWLVGKLSLSVKFGGKKFNNFGLIAMILEIVIAICTTIMFALQTYVFANHLYEIISDSSANAVPNLVTSPDFPRALDILLETVSIATGVLHLPYLAVLVFLYIGFFRMYAPMSYIWMVVLCVIIQPVFGILAFAFRNRTAIDYEAIARKRMEQIYKMEHPDAYGANGQNNEPADPFGEFSSGTSDSESTKNTNQNRNDDNPFDEF